MKVPLLDLSAQNGPLRGDVLAAITRVVDSGQFIMGPDVEGLERELAAHLDVAHVLGVSSGTDALLLALMALGIGPGDEVVTTPFSFFATVGAVVRLGAKVVLADIDPASFNLDPARTLAAVTSRTKAIIPVHLFGRAAELPSTEVPIVEDAAQSIGCVPLAGAVGCLSFFPSKNLGAFGDAGAVYTRDARLAERMKLLRTHGAKPKYVHQAVGGNFRLDSLQAAVLRVKLPHLAGWTAGRRKNADRYRALFAATPGIPAELVTPTDAPGHIYNQFCLRAPRRDALKEHLTAAGIGNEIYYPVPFHLQPCFTAWKLPLGAFPESERAAKEALAIPISAELTEAQQAHVVETIASFYKGSK